MGRADTDDSSDSNWTRTAVVLCSLLVVIATAALMPAFGTDGAAGSPLEQILPGESAGETAGDSQFGNSSGLGALNPGDSTGIGGDVGLDSDTYATTDTAIHFTVESTTSSYWRTGAYDRFTGSGWERTGETEPLDGSVEYEGVDGERIEWEIQFRRSATAVPTAWRPKVVDGVDDPLVTDQGAVLSEQSIGVGKTVEGVSSRPQQDEGALRAAGENYPTEIAEQYTQLPADTPPRVEQFTSDLTADDETPYEQAKTIEAWLERSKEYDLDASQRTDTIADTFIFEMDAGYCEYFATSMVSMLRSQDIPARYVVGYSSGQPVGDSTYEVRAMNAHAWVEVYFEDLGWIRFDPTPAGPRLSTQEQALEDAGEEFDIDDVTVPEDIQPGEDEVDSDGFRAELNQTALPGEPVEVTVTDSGLPVPSETVYFNGEPVGTTDENGVVVGTVPDAEELQITVRDAGTAGDDGILEEQTGDADMTATAALGGVGTGSVTTAATSGGQDDERSETHPIERSATVAVSGDTVTGETVTVTVSAGDLLLDNATVSVDGQPVGQTDKDGQLAIDLPEEPGNVTVTAERGLVSGERAIEVMKLAVTVESGRLPAMALGTVTVSAEVGDEPVAGRPVEIDGNEVATTAADGTATVRVPLQSEVTIAVVGASTQDRIVLSGLLWRFGLAALLVGTLFVTPFFALQKRGYGPLVVARFLPMLPGRLFAGGRRVLVQLVTHGDEYLARAVDRVGRLFGTVSAVVRGEKTLTDLKTTAVTWLSGVRTRGWRLLAQFRTGNRQETADTGETVQEAWRRFVNELTVSSVETRTPGELAAYAVEEDNLPEEPVVELRDTFREVEYGSRPPTDRLDRIQDAVREIESTEEGDS